MLDGDKRVLSVDALRGAAILCIVGADGVALALKAMAGDSDLAVARAARFVGTQFSHAHWDGFHFFDLIFPLFLFTVGLSIPLSLAKFRAEGNGSRALPRVVRRSALLFILGIAYYFDYSQPTMETRLTGVLQRIAVCYLIAATLFLYLQPRMIWYVTVGIIIAYGFLVALVPVPGSQLDPYDPAMNLAIWIDSHWLPGKKQFGRWDPEGLLTTLPAVASCLIGVIAGRALQNENIAPAMKSAAFVCAGICVLAAGYAISFEIPIIKNLWTASYVLVAGGWSLILFGLTHRLMDVAGHIRWAGAFVWTGANAILIYALDGFIEFDNLFLSLVGREAITYADGLTLPGVSALIANAVSLGLLIALARALYIRKLFLRI